MVIRVAVEREEFSAACTNGFVYGSLTRRSVIYVYVELGTEKEYIPQPADNPNTKYRIFTNCHVFFAETEEQMDEELFAAEQRDLTVIIYC